jgi:polysaccharide pyruvyl transferase WcaK-like protein
MKKTNFSKEITILGYYGDNFGDLLMLNGLLKNIPDTYKINILTYSSCLNTRDLDISLDRIEIYDLNKKGKFKNILKSVSKSQKIFWGGGTCFNDIDGTGGIKTMLICFLLGKKCYYFGIGIDYIKNLKSKVYVLIALIISSKMYLRDELSYKVIKQLFPSFVLQIFKNKISLIPDIASLNFTKNTEQSQLENELLISYRNVAKYFDNHNDYLNMFILNIEDFVLRNNVNKINIIDADSDVDESDSIQIYNFLNKNYNVSYKKALNLNEKLNIIKGSKFIITGRLHIAFVSMFYDKKFILLNYSDKNRAFIKENNLPYKILVEYDDLNIPFEFVSYKSQKNQIIEKNNFILGALNEFI